jgi:Outer membrane protein beta-barrel domain
MRLFSKLSLLVLLSSAACFAQFPVSIGVKAGVPITDSFNNTSFGSLGNQIIGYSNSKNYIVGPMVELKLPFHLSVEADALYRPLTVTTNASNVIISSDRATWEFPILAKYHFAFPIVSPYIEAGPSFRTSASAISYLSNSGVTVGAGVDVHALVLRISPEFRYTHWSSDSSPIVGNPYISSKQDQVEFLVGFSF